MKKSEEELGGKMKRSEEELGGKIRRSEEEVEEAKKRLKWVRLFL